MGSHPLSHFLKLSFGNERNNSMRDWFSFGAENLLTMTMCHFLAGLCVCMYIHVCVLQKETEGQVSALRGGAQCCKGARAVLR